ncbi:hypothetical protein SY88_02210 [Clostridiales bacterium PH28_bin88]|nr:hypothetical protein SY88_02210 [Clostridiales bacterium PH28_bin88]
MDCMEKVTDFFMKQKSTVAAVENFIEQFMGIYGNIKAQEKELLSQCIQQMFRKYYYTPMVPDIFASPANMTNMLIEREFGKGIVVLPTLKPEYKGKKIKYIHLDVTCFQTDNHHFIKDMETFLETAKEGIPLEEPGILPPEEHGRIRNKVLLDDRHYFNIISLTALEAGLLESMQQDDGKILGRTSPKVGEFLRLDGIQKLRLIVDAVVKHFSRTMVEVFPEIKDMFSVNTVENLLMKPVDLEDLFTPVFKKLGLDEERMESIFYDVVFNEEFQISDEDAMKMVKAMHALLYYDMYFLTPFGYYLQLIQPAYEDEYIMEAEVFNILEHVDNFRLARTKLFSGAASYDLTSLGEALLGEGRKPVRKQALGEDFDDDKMFEIIEDSRNYYDEDEEDENDFDIDDLAFLLHGTRAGRPEDRIKTHNGRNVDISVLNRETDKMIFVFKVTKYRSKRTGKQIEIKGTQTLDDLHESISSAFELDWGHLYSFFMSNKAWDSKTEYCHPQAEGRSAENAKIGNLDLAIKQKFMYLYDYGDELKFEVELADIKEPEKGVKYPRISS